MYKTKKVPISCRKPISTKGEMFRQQYTIKGMNCQVNFNSIPLPDPITFHLNKDSKYDCLYKNKESVEGTA